MFRLIDVCSRLSSRKAPVRSCCRVLVNKSHQDTLENICVTDELERAFRSAVKRLRSFGVAQKFCECQFLRREFLIESFPTFFGCQSIFTRRHWTAACFSSDCHWNRQYWKDKRLWGERFSRWLEASDFITNKKVRHMWTTHSRFSTSYIGIQPTLSRRGTEKLPTAISVLSAGARENEIMSSGWEWDESWFFPFPCFIVPSSKNMKLFINCSCRFRRWKFY